MNGPLKGIFAGIFLCSLSSIAFEIALTRIFSISLWYHFAFMVVSMVMLGMGLSGTVLSLAPGLKSRGNLGLYALLLALSMPAGYLLSNLVPFDPVRLSWDRTQIFLIGAYYIILGVPFFFFGLIMSCSFALFREKSGLLYGADLLGAGAGSVAVILLMGALGPERTVFVISLAAASGAFLMGRRRAGLGIGVAVLAVLIINPGFIGIRMSPYKGLQLALKYPGAELLGTYHSGFSRVDVFKSPMARFAPGLSLTYLDELPRQIGLSVDGASLDAITEAGRPEFLRYLPSGLPYELKGTGEVLVMEPKGGLQVLMARDYGFQDIQSVESNPLIVDVIREDFGEFSGGIYDENTWKGLARSWLKGNSRRFDIIDVSLTGATPSALFGISEDYRFTVEAFSQYLRSLKEDGILGITLFILPPPRTELRVLSTAVRAMGELGMENPGRHIAAIRSWGTVTMLVKASPLSTNEIDLIKGFARKRRFDLVYYPGIKEDETGVYIKTPSSDYYQAFEAIIHPETREAFKKNYLFDIREVHDDNPFFHYYLRLGNVREIYRLAGGKWQYFIEEGSLLPALLAQVAVLSLVLLLLPLAARRQYPVRGASLGYFALLGLGFMFVEVPLIQKMILPLGNPSYAVAAVLASILASSGAGSLLSQRIPFLRTPYVLAALSVLIIPYGLLLTPLTDDISAFSLPVKIVLSFLLILPAGLLMGIPFPLGIRTIREELIPWAWAVNGCFSVLAPILSIMLAMWVGFKWVFMLGALMYALAFLALKGIFRRGEQ
jgi:hypothetical protein